MKSKLIGPAFPLLEFSLLFSFRAPEAFSQPFNRYGSFFPFLPCGIENKNRGKHLKTCCGQR